jgi:hypothetical protein
MTPPSNMAAHQASFETHSTFQLDSLAFAYHIREKIIGSFRVFGASSPMIHHRRASSPAGLVNPTGPWAGRGYSSGPLSRSRCPRHVRQYECLDDTSEVWADDACRHKESLRDHSGSLGLRGHESRYTAFEQLTYVSNTHLLNEQPRITRKLNPTVESTAWDVTTTLGLFLLDIVITR